MQKRIVMISLFFLLVLGGFFVVKAMNGEATALNDSFTKEFIAEEFVEEDFHLFESKTGQYRMLFPNEFQMISEPAEYYGRRGEGFEMWNAMVYEDTNDGIRYDFRVMFRESEADLTSTRLNVLLENNSYQNQYDELDNDRTIIYHGLSHWEMIDTKSEFRDPKQSPANNFFGLIKDRHSNRTIEFVYSTICYKEELGCKIDSDEQYKFALKLMKSIEFLGQGD
ncbi:hypothetical protein RYX45_06620 [Alkalihalophilus pseudofirmus]|uniref:Uncharacterized protein n=1 Tax=Alkalihalophilus pseudofirmus TaxID=79885 RepID=A0AAJ2KXB3_ALKPS|nr:hypothetical protein [Alkalihalophilus pseudofirmus]MDV2884845.1 hypothetical protein [Alkalihalophilus pseudofirmus]